MAVLNKKDYEDIYRNEEYNPQGLCRLIYVLTGVVIVVVALILIF